jgi:hypothetical protein
MKKDETIGQYPARARIFRESWVYIDGRKRIRYYAVGDSCLFRGLHDVWGWGDSPSEARMAVGRNIIRVLAREGYFRGGQR